MRNIVFTCVILLVGLNTSYGQEKWDLRKCVDYALANNISIQQSVVQEHLSELTYKQSKDGRWPSANFQGNGGEQFGRSVDPTTNLFTTNAISFMNLGLQSGVTLFNFFSIKNSIDANRLTMQANKAQTDKIRNDIALNVAASYLQALLSHEQERTSIVQIGQTQEQLDVTRKRVDAGDLPELNAAELEAQLARDSAAYVAAHSQYLLNLLSLKALLNIDAATPFDIATPAVESIPVDPLSELEPEYVYALAVKTQPLQLANELRFKAAQKMTASAKGQLYPTLGGFINLNTGYSSALGYLYTGIPTVTYNPSALYVPVNGINYPVYTPSQEFPNVDKATLFRQFDRNFRQSVGLSLQVPIFNGNQAKTNLRKAKMNELSQSLQMKADSQQLKQDIFQAYENAINGLQTVNSRKKTVETAQRSFDLGRKRYEVGLLPTLDLITLQNNLSRAKIDMLSAQYDYVFRLKILEFYKGNGIRL